MIVFAKGKEGIVESVVKMQRRCEMLAEFTIIFFSSRLSRTSQLFHRRIFRKRFACSFISVKGRGAREYCRKIVETVFEWVSLQLRFTFVCGHRNCSFVHANRCNLQAIWAWVNGAGKKGTK